MKCSKCNHELDKYEHYEELEDGIILDETCFYELAIQAINKQTPQEPNYPYNDNTEENAYCPNCSMIVKDLYCGTCGQKIKW